MIHKWLHLTRAVVRTVAGVLLCLCLVGAAGESDMVQGIIIAGGFLLALVSQGWALQRNIDRKMDERIGLHRRACHPASVEDLAGVREALARVETRLDAMDKKLDRLNG
jgi:hypothetical protein